MDFKEIWQMLVDAHVVEIVYALGILLLGWIIALCVAGGVATLINKTGIDRKLSSLSDSGDAPAIRLDKIASRIVFWAIFILALLGALSVLQLSETAAPIRSFIDSIAGYVPNLLGGVLLFCVAWIVAAFFRIGVLTLSKWTKLDERFPASVKEDGSKLLVSQTVSRAAYWLVLLFFVPAILRALRIEGITRPLEDMLARILDFLPNLFLGAAVLVVGFWAACIVRKAVTVSLDAVRLDSFGDKLGVNRILGEQKLSKLAGLVAYVLIAIPILIAALSALKIDTLSNSLGALLDKILGATGNIFGVVVLLFTAFVLGGIASGIVTQLLAGFGFDKLTKAIGFEEKAGRPTPSLIVGKLVLAAILFFAAIASCETLGFMELAGVLRTFVQFAGNVVLATVVVLVGLWLANLAASAVSARGKGLALTVKIAVLAFTGAIALSHIDLGGRIVELAFGLILGSVCVAAALAFGLGGREFAAGKLKEWHDKLAGK